MILNPEQVKELKVKAEINKEENQDILNLIDTIIYLVEQLNP